MNRIPHYKRLDFAIIWSNGLSDEENILNDVESFDFFEIIYFKRLSNFKLIWILFLIYGNDFVSLQHLYYKTKYLYKCKRELLIIIGVNHSPSEHFCGNYRPRHIACKNILEMKNFIRSKYNKKTSLGKITHEHVIHISDNMSQTYKFLRDFNLCSLHSEFQNSDNCFGLNIKHHLKLTNTISLECINIDDIQASIITGDRWSKQIIQVLIDETPHYQALMKDDIDIYALYISKYRGCGLNDYYSVAKFMRLKKDITSLFNRQESLNNLPYPVVDRRSENSYIILDGLHRLSIMKYLGIKRTFVAILE